MSLYVERGLARQKKERFMTSWTFVLSIFVFCLLATGFQVLVDLPEAHATEISPEEQVHQSDKAIYEEWEGQTKSICKQYLTRN